jgi:protein associated with RNAse G/E
VQVVNDRQEISVLARNFDGSERRRWKADLICHRPPFIELLGEFDRDIEHSDLGFIFKGTISYEFYWLDRWFNVFRFHEPTGEFRNFYCNINTPPIFKNNVLDYIDLDIDVVVDGKGIITILDIEEFRENSLKYSIPDSIQTSVYTTLEKILLLIRSQEFPFDDDEPRRR